MSRRTEESDPFRKELVEILPKLRRFAYGLAGTRADGDDLLQGAIAKALTSRDQWQPGTRLDSWLYRITQNHWIDTVRRRKTRDDRTPLDDVIDAPGDDGRRTVEGAMAITKLKKAMDLLPEEQRSVLVLVTLEGLSYAEAAATLEIPIGTVMSRLARARASLSLAVYGEAKNTQ